MKVLQELRDSCLDCVRKHLGQASALMAEVRQDYPAHRWLAVGHMAEAAEECVKDYPKLADEIRKHRLRYMMDLDYAVPIVKLIEMASRLTLPSSTLPGAREDVQLAEERAERCGSVAASMLKPGTKVYEKWLAKRNRTRKRNAKKRAQQEDNGLTRRPLKTLQCVA